MLVEVVTAVSFMYFVLLVVLSLRRDEPVAPGGDDIEVVFVVPCLNEALVIERTIRSLLAVRGSVRILLVDDDSDDDTVAIATALDPERVEVLQRRLPEARTGKGHSLNHAFRHLADSELAAHVGHDRLVIGVVDADGEISADTVQVIAPLFDDPQVGAVQIGVAMYNRTTNLLTRMQDYEFAVYTEIMQRARQRIGSVGLGGNGQFARLSALETLGDEPWTECLAEDLDLGLRLLLGGWSNRYCRQVEVRQQAVAGMRAWVRQRKRWFQGHVQCWRHIPAILRSRKLSIGAAADITWYLLMPIAILLAPLPLYAALGVLVVGVGVGAVDVGWILHLVSWQGLLLAYFVMFAPAYVYAWFYQRRRGIGWIQSIVLAHALEVYCNLWIVAGWMAVGRIVARRRSWAKTARIADPVVDPVHSATDRDDVVEDRFGVLGVEAERA